MRAASQSLGRKVKTLQLDQRTGRRTEYYYLQVYNQPFA